MASLEKSENKNGLFHEIHFGGRILTKLTLEYHFQYGIIKNNNGGYDGKPQQQILKRRARGHRY